MPASVRPRLLFLSLLAIALGASLGIATAPQAAHAQDPCPAGYVALTFDDGPDDHTDGVLDVLARHDVAATFFVLGRKVAEDPATVQRTADEGHEVANHSYTHADLEGLTYDEVVAEIADTDQAIRDAGVTPLPLLRPPYGHWGGPGGTVDTAAGDLGYDVVTWNVNPSDYVEPASVIERRVLDGLHDGANVLLHDGVPNATETIAALPGIIEGARDAGYCFGLLNEQGDVVPATVDPFVDVPADSTHASDIERLAAAGITRGCNPPVNDRFCPDRVLTRQEMATFLVRSLGLEERAEGRFVDVEPGSTHEADIERLAAAGITRGCNPPVNDRFCPNRQLPRDEMATLLVRAFLD